MPGTGPFKLLDLGEIYIPPRRSDQEPVATQYIELRYGLASGVVASNVASPGLDIQAIMLVPLDIAAGVFTGASTGATARDWHRFESYPEQRAIRSNASVFYRDVTAQTRGMAPRLPPTGSPGASGPLQVFVMQGRTGDFRGNDVINVSLSARERFSFYR